MPTMDTGTVHDDYPTTLYLIDPDPRPRGRTSPAHTIVVPMGVALDDGDAIPGVAFHSASISPSGVFCVTLDVEHESLTISDDGHITIGGNPVVGLPLDQQPEGFTGDTDGRLISIYLARIDTRCRRDRELLTSPFFGAYHQMWRQSPPMTAPVESARQ